MKKITTLLACIILVFSAAFAANGTDISKNALATFSESYPAATNIKWEKNETYYTASFQLNGESLKALLSEDGMLMAVCRNIVSTGLPIGLQAPLNKQLAGYWISDLVEYAIDNTTIYYVTLENADKKTILASVGTYDWTLFEKIAK